MPHKRAKFSVRMADRASKGKDLAPTTSQKLDIATLPKGAMRILQAEQVQKAYHERRKQQQQAKLLSESKGKGKAMDTSKEELKMRPGERARDFHRRVEDAYAGEINQTIRATSSSTSKKHESQKKRRQTSASKDDEGDDDDPDERFRKRRAASNDGKDRGPTKADLKREREVLEFEKANQRRRVNDVVQAPPTLTKAPRGEGAAAKKRKAELKALLSGGQVQEEKKQARLPEPVQYSRAAASQPKGGLKRQKDLDEERDRAIKAYRAQKQKQG